MYIKTIWKEAFFKGSNIYVSNKGKVWSGGRDFIFGNGGKRVSKKGIFKGFLNTYGYLKIHFCIKAVSTETSIHRLVAKLFIPNPENKRTVNHKNGIKTDNRVENLEWATNLENNRHSHAIGLVPKKLSKAQVVAIKNMFKIENKKQPEIAKIFNIHQCHVSRIVNEKRRAIN